MNSLFSRFFVCEYQTYDENIDNILVYSNAKNCCKCRTPKHNFVTPCFHCNGLFPKSKVDFHENSQCFLKPFDTDDIAKHLIITISLDSSDTPFIEKYLVKTLQFYNKDFIFSTFLKVCQLQPSIHQRTMKPPNAQDLKIIKKLQSQMDMAVISSEPEESNVQQGLASLSRYSMIFICNHRTMQQSLTIANNIKYNHKINMTEHRRILIVHDPEQSYQSIVYVGEILVLTANFNNCMIDKISGVFDAMGSIFSCSKAKNGIC